MGYPSLGYGFRSTKQNISIGLFMMVDRMAIAPMVTSDGFYPTMEAIATALGVEVAKALASTMQES